MYEFYGIKFEKIGYVDRHIQYKITGNGVDEIRTTPLAWQYFMDEAKSIAAELADIDFSKMEDYDLNQLNWVSRQDSQFNWEEAKVPSDWDNEKLRSQGARPSLQNGDWVLKRAIEVKNASQTHRDFLGDKEARGSVYDPANWIGECTKPKPEPEPEPKREIESDKIDKVQSLLQYQHGIETSWDDANALIHADPEIQKRVCERLKIKGLLEILQGE